jgi:hypothetical protein
MPGMVLAVSSRALAFAAVFLRVRQATSTRFPLERVDFAFPAPASVAEHERIFECPVRFDVEASAFHVERAAWETANGRADPVLFGVLTGSQEGGERGSDPEAKSS